MPQEFGQFIKSKLCHYALIGVDSSINDIEKIINNKGWDEQSKEILKMSIKGHVNNLDAIFTTCKEIWDADDEIKNYDKIKKRIKKMGI